MYMHAAGVNLELKSTAPLSSQLGAFHDGGAGFGEQTGYAQPAQVAGVVPGQFQRSASFDASWTVGYNKASYGHPELCSRPCV